MKKIANLIIILIVIVVAIVVVPTIVNAKDKVESSTVINGVTVNWKYSLNSNNEIDDLICTNSHELLGTITIPAKIDNHNVVGIGGNAFKNATNLTKVTIPDSAKEIGYHAFEGCTKLSEVDLGKIEKISFEVFTGCTSLKEITIPKTLKNGATTPCLNNSNITKITLEEGLTIVPSYLCANTGITEITIPGSVKEIGYHAFEGCTKLSEVNLGKIEKISFEVFTGCTSLTEITIPKTLKNSATTPCLNNPSITKITLEEGLTIVPNYLCANTGITKVTIPDSVKEIGYHAFEGCTKLSEVDLGKIEKIGFEVFTGCTSLKEITIPKTLKNGATTPCLNNPNITKITLEEGLTVVPSYLCANTGITGITIPSSVREIEYSAFDNCTKLKKITILDNVDKMGFFDVSDKESIFKNHNDDLTIYCYDDSLAAKYAIKYQIKYVYLEKDVKDNPKLTATVSYNPKTKDAESVVVTIKTSNKVNKVDAWTLSKDGKTLTKTYKGNKTETVTLTDEYKQTAKVEIKITNIKVPETAKEETKDNSIANKTIPYAGSSNLILIPVAVIIGVGIVAYIKKKQLEQI